MTFPTTDAWTAAAGRVAAVSRPFDDVPSEALGAATTMRFVAGGDLTGRRFGLFRWDMQPGAGGADGHFHRTFSESFYVIDGTVDLYDGVGWTPHGPGDFLYVPEGGIHGFHVTGDAPSSMLILFSPAPPREAYFHELQSVMSGDRTLSREEWLELWARHDQYPA